MLSDSSSTERGEHLFKHSSTQGAARREVSIERRCQGALVTVSAEFLGASPIVLRVSSTDTDFLLPVDFPSAAAIMDGSVSVVPGRRAIGARSRRLLATFLKNGGESKGWKRRVAGVFASEGLIRRGSQVVRPRSAKPLFTGSIPVPASLQPSELIREG